MTDNAASPDGLMIPPRGDPDRKRVLGILAQRRYRDRKKRIRNSRQISSNIPSAVAPDNVTDDMVGGVMHCSAPDSRTDLPLGNGLDDLIGDMSTWDSTSAMLADATSLWVPSDSLICSQSQTLETASFTFPDDKILEVPVLKLMRAAMNIATNLNLTQLLWDPASRHVMDPSRWETFPLPWHFYPVDAQLRIPHHALFDILPWPGVRNKLIRAFALPAELQPPAVRDPLALINLAYDIDDESEGFRIAGPDGTDAASWEVGQKMFSNWWWALDRDVIRQSNRLRQKRGAKMLTLEPVQ